MGEIKLSIEDSMRVLNNPDSDQEARVISACAVAFFETNKATGELSVETRFIAHKLLRMTASAIDEDVDE